MESDFKKYGNLGDVVLLALFAVDYNKHWKCTRYDILQSQVRAFILSECQGNNTTEYQTIL